MKKGFYTLPLNFQDMMPDAIDDGSRNPAKHLMLDKTHSMKKSVDEFIELIITTHLGEYKHDNDFGFEIWDIEFENMQIEKFNTHNYPKQDLEQYLQSKIKKFEPRIKDCKVEILFVHKKVFKGMKIKYFVDITVKGVLLNTYEEDYARSFQFAMGPFFK